MPRRRAGDVGVQLVCPSECCVAHHVVLFPEDEGPLPPAKTEGKREMLCAVVVLKSFPQKLPGAVVDGNRLGLACGGVRWWGLVMQCLEDILCVDKFHKGTEKS